MSKRPSPSGLHKGDDPVTDWATIRIWVLNRDEHICQTCKVNVAGEVDHIWPRRLGGADHIDNLRAICGPCNKAKGARIDLAAATRSQLVLARNALRARIETIEAEYNDVVNEDLRRSVAGDSGAVGALNAIRADVRRREQVVAEWEKLYEVTCPPLPFDGYIGPLERAIKRLLGRGDLDHAETGLSDLEILRLLRTFVAFRRFINAYVPLEAWDAVMARKDQS